MHNKTRVALEKKDVKIHIVESVAIPIIVFALVSAIFIFFVILNHLIYDYMLKASRALSGLMNLNSVYDEDFTCSTKQPIFVHIKCKSKPQYDGKTIEHAFNEYLQEHYLAYKPICSQYKHETALYADYKAMYKENASKRLKKLLDDESSFRTRTFCWIEAKIYENQMLPAPSLRINVLRTYTSPKKRNYYSEKTSFYSATFIKIMDDISELESRRKKASEERKKLTPALRYRVLVRDLFTCQICGRTQKDGAILQIDHIIPIAKGGKTVLENLRVLCSECNVGKGASFDPNGLN